MDSNDAGPHADGDAYASDDPTDTSAAEQEKMALEAVEKFKALCGAGDSDDSGKRGA